MANKKLLIFSLLLLAMIAIAGGLFLLKREQDIRNSAAGGVPNGCEGLVPAGSSCCCRVVHPGDVCDENCIWASDGPGKNLAMTNRGKIYIQFCSDSDNDGDFDVIAKESNINHDCLVNNCTQIRSDILSGKTVDGVVCSRCNNKIWYFPSEQPPTPTVPSGTTPTPQSGCPFTSTQAQVQKNSSDPWGDVKTITQGSSFNIAGFHNHSGVLSEDVDFFISGPGGLSKEIRVPCSGGYVCNYSPQSPGVYTIEGKTKKPGGGYWSESACKDVATVTMEGPTPTNAPTNTPTNTPTSTPTNTPTPMPIYSCRCLKVKMYDYDWNEITDDISLKLGDRVHFTVLGETDDPDGLTKARFKVNRGEWQETTDRRGEEFQIEYQIEREGEQTVEAQVFSPKLGWR
ncbi:hypothetical protein KKD61_01650 [Patescibacteria group bacterium]|nr:hypothetical protein [Patescibacteria group bacterium]